MTLRLDRESLAEVLDAGRAGGLHEVGWCRARSWTATRSRIEAHRGAGRHGGMAFTFRNPGRSTDPARVLRGGATLVVGALSYAQERPPAPGGPVVGARVAAYATADHYGRLAAALGVVADDLRGRGARAVVVADSNALVDREAAWRAGIGWYGRNSLVLAPGRGSWFVLGSVVTDAVVEPSVPAPVPVPDACGTCRRCVDACPTGAIVADGVVDARRCLAWLLQAPGTFPPEFREALADRIYGCDDCQEVCPPNRATELRLGRRGDLPVEGDPGAWIDACELLELDDDALIERCARWYVPGRDPAVVRRNLLLVLGNSGRGHDRRVRELVERHRTGSDPLLAEHAAWAAARLDGADAAPGGAPGSLGTTSSGPTMMDAL